MKAVTIFNNKGGVGKTTLTYHLANALAEMKYRILLIDLDPQCNLTIMAMETEELHEIWLKEDDFIDDFQATRNHTSPDDFNSIISSPRSIHFLLKPTEDGLTDLDKLSPPRQLSENLDLIPGRLTLHLYEEKISGRWSDVYQGDPLAIRTVTKFRDLAVNYARERKYDFVLIDTSPSLGILNRVVISTADGFLIPCAPDMFSLYGVRNIGNSLKVWERQFATIKKLLSSEKLSRFPPDFVSLLGFTIYNAKRYSGEKHPWNLATAHYHYAQQIPEAIEKYIAPETRGRVPDAAMREPIGETAIMHSHNTLPSMAQKYHLPIWAVPSLPQLEPGDASTVRGNRKAYEDTKGQYTKFATSLLERIKFLG
jgi:cellulose biosynthesis protein BcsQ